MSRKLAVLAVLAVACLAFATTTQAQTVMTEVKQGTVVSVGQDYLVVKMADGTVKGFDVPRGFMFDVGGTQVPLSALKPGQALTATVTTTTQPQIVKTEEVKQGTVVRVVAATLLVQMADGTYKSFVVPKGFLFEVDGKKVGMEELRPGMKLSATLVSEKEIGTVSAKEVQISASAPPPAKAAAPAPAVAPPPPPPAPAKKLPKTAGPLPLIGLLGLLSLGLGAGLSFRRRRE